MGEIIEDLMEESVFEGAKPGELVKQVHHFHQRSTSTPMRLSNVGIQGYSSNSLPKNEKGSGPSSSRETTPLQENYETTQISHNNYQKSHPELRNRSSGSKISGPIHPQSIVTLSSSKSMVNYNKIEQMAVSANFTKSFDNLNGPSQITHNNHNNQRGRFSTGSRPLTKRLSNPMPYNSRDNSESNDLVPNSDQFGKKSMSTSRESTREIKEGVQLSNVDSVSNFSDKTPKSRISSGNSTRPLIAPALPLSASEETPTATKSIRPMSPMTPTSPNTRSLFRQRKSASELLKVLSPDSKYYKMSNARARLGRSISPTFSMQDRPGSTSILIRNGSSNSKASNENFDDNIFDNELRELQNGSFGKEENGEEKDADALSIKMWEEFENTKTLKKVANQFEKRSSERMSAMFWDGLNSLRIKITIF